VTLSGDSILVEDSPTRDYSDTEDEIYQSIANISTQTNHKMIDRFSIRTANPRCHGLYLMDLCSVARVENPDFPSTRWKESIPAYSISFS